MRSLQTRQTKLDRALVKRAIVPASPGPMNRFQRPGQMASPWESTPKEPAPSTPPTLEALLRLTGEIRVMRPDVYLSITTGTWPSPYWLWYGDSVWRNGHT